jgi:hippurate hydrolase
MTISDDLFASLEQGLDWQRELYKDLHRNPELSMEEHRTADRIEQELTGFGYQVQRIGGTGVVGVLDNGSGATVLSRADIDALPVKEATGLDYASENDGVMHACGHDMHITALLGAAKLMAAHRDVRELVEIGAYVTGTNPDADRATAIWQHINAFLRQGLDERVTPEEAWAHLHALVNAA